MKYKMINQEMFRLIKTINIHLKFLKISRINYKIDLKIKYEIIINKLMKRISKTFNNF